MDSSHILKEEIEKTHLTFFVYVNKFQLHHQTVTLNSLRMQSLVAKGTFCDLFGTVHSAVDWLNEKLKFYSSAIIG